MDNAAIPVKFLADLDVTVDTTLKFHQHITNIIRKASIVAINLLKSIVNCDPLFMNNLFISRVQHTSIIHTALWNLHYAGDRKRT